MLLGFVWLEEERRDGERGIFVEMRKSGRGRGCIGFSWYDNFFVRSLERENRSDREKGMGTLKILFGEMRLGVR